MIKEYINNKRAEYRREKFMTDNLMFIGGKELVGIYKRDKKYATGETELAIQEAMLKMPFEDILRFRKQWYEKVTGEKLDWFHPKNYGQKMQQVMLFGANETKTRLTDKVLVKDYVREKIGEEYVIPTLGVWDSFDEIDFDGLPDKFRLKTNHSCGTNLIVTDKSEIDFRRQKKIFDRWMIVNHGASMLCELHYRDIVPKIFAEQYIAPSDGNLIDYKIICINGEPELTNIIGERKSGHPRQTVVNKYGEYVFQKGSVYPVTERKSLVPDNFSELLDIARKLSEGIDYVRVDLYNVDGKIYFGEMTFTPRAFSSGAVLHPENWEALSDEAKAFIKEGPERYGYTENK